MYTLYRNVAPNYLDTLYRCGTLYRMGQKTRTVWVCEYRDCGHEWLAEKGEPPEKCAKCRRRRWHGVGVGEAEKPQEAPKRTRTKKVPIPQPEPLETSESDDDIEALISASDCPLGSGCKLLCDPPWFKCTGCGRYRDGR